MKRFLIECGVPLSVPAAGTITMIVLAVSWRRPPQTTSPWWTFGPMSTGFFLASGTFVISCLIAAWIWNEGTAPWFAGLVAAFGAAPFVIWLCMW